MRPLGETSKALKQDCGAAGQERTTIPDDDLRLCAADGPDGGLCVWRGPAMVKMALFFCGSQSATLRNMLVHKNLPLCLAVH